MRQIWSKAGGRKERRLRWAWQIKLGVVTGQKKYFLQLNTFKKVSKGEVSLTVRFFGNVTLIK